MEKQHVTQILQELAEQEVPDNVDLWPAIQARVQPRRRSSRWAQLMPNTRLGWAFLILSLLLVVGATAYAVNLWEVMPFWQHIEEAGLGQEVHLSQTLNGFTVTLERVYADANQIVVGFIVSGPPDQKVHLTRITLSDDRGTEFRGMVGAGTDASGTLGVSVSLPPGTGGEVFVFDASPVQGRPSELELYLEVELWATELHSTPTAKGETPAQPVQEESGAQMAEDRRAIVMATPAQTMRDVRIVGPFTFDFSVPFIPGRTIKVHQTVEAAGVAARLEQVVVTPSETRAILCFEPPDGDHRKWIPIATLDTGDEQDLSGIVKPLSGATWYVQSGRLRFKADESVSAVDETEKEGCYRYSFLASLQDQREWTLTVTELVGTDIERLEAQILRQADSGVVTMDAAEAAEFQTRLAGPWVFRFGVP